LIYNIKHRGVNKEKFKNITMILKIYILIMVYKKSGFKYLFTLISAFIKIIIANITILSDPNSPKPVWTRIFYILTIYIIIIIITLWP